jgi:hypothetical protein
MSPSRLSKLLIMVVASVIVGCGDEQPTETVAPVKSATSQTGTRHGTYGKPPATAGSTSAIAAAGLVTSNLSVVTATELAQYLAGPGVTISDVTYTGVSRAAGKFSGGTGIIGFEDGIILSTGNIAYVAGSNTVPDITYSNGRSGDAALTTLSGFETYDKAVLTFKFVPTASRIYFEYVFASEEYNEWVDTEFNDVFAFWVNGVNCAVIDGDPVSINTINHGQLASHANESHPHFYINNDPHDGGVDLGALRQTEMDGFTVVLTCDAAVNPGVQNTMRLAIADAGDDILDANVFIRRSSLTTEVPKPNAPTAILATPVSPNQINVTWHDVSTNETSFKLQKRTQVGGVWGAWGALANKSANVEQHNDTGLAAQSKHQYRVRACNAGGCSAYATSAGVTTYDDNPLPAKPTNLVATAQGPAEVRLTWTDASWNETSFTLIRRQAVDGVYGSWSTVGSPTANTTSFNDATAQPGTAYEYRIRACNGTGCSGYSLAASVTTPVPAPPAAPSDVAAFATSATDIFVYWADNSSDEDEFTVQRRVYTGGVWGSWVLVIKQVANAPYYSDTGLTANTKYQYRVRACNAAGCSVYVTSAAVTTPAAAPAAPAGGGGD